MADFTIRIVLHGATAQHYANLHEAMIKAGAHRTIRGDDGVLYDLPDGEYVTVEDHTATQVRNGAVAVAKRVMPNSESSVFVTQAQTRAWRLRPVPGES